LKRLRHSCDDGKSARSRPVARRLISARAPRPAATTATTAIATPIAVAATTSPCLATPLNGVALNGAALTWPVAMPFLGLLLTIAIAPMLAAPLWRRHYGKIVAVWSIVAVAALAAQAGIAGTLAAVLQTMLSDYLGFIVLLFALYVVAGGILVTGNLRGSPLGNTGMLFAGMVLASVVGTTGAAMIVLRPLIRANERRRHKAHVLVFAIFLVANIAGTVTPLGNPPLFVGFLHGVDFFWTMQHLLPATCFIAGLVLAIFVVIDVWLYRREGLHPARHGAETVVRVHGWINMPLIAAIIAAIVLCAAWRPPVTINFAGSEVAVQDLLRDAMLIALAIASLKLTPAEHRDANGFSWKPIREVAILFAGIFICIIPVLGMLQAGPGGAFSRLLTFAGNGGEPHDLAFFWLCGTLSAFLDNAPTYLVFFKLAGGNATDLMGPLAGTLAAISVGASAMGALTYIGNAPNLMIQAIATERGIAMPDFFGFMLWSGAVLLPVFALTGYVFFG
jgi:Na+/H+ antiporter NhaD/arsenite permease-like protein